MDKETKEKLKLASRFLKDVNCQFFINKININVITEEISNSNIKDTIWILTSNSKNGIRSYLDFLWQSLLEDRGSQRFAIQDSETVQHESFWKGWRMLKHSYNENKQHFINKISKIDIKEILIK